MGGERTRRDDAGMSPRLRWSAAIAAALCLHLPWWPRPVPPARPVAAAAAPRPAPHVLLRQAVGPAAAPPPAATARGSAGPPARRRAVRAALPGGAASAPAAPLFVPPPDTVLDYHWTQGTRTRPVRLSWSTDRMAYRVTLETLPGAPAAAGWLRSDGTWHGASGLAPRRFTAKRPGQSEQAISFLRDGAGPPEAAFSATTFRTPLDKAAQDALSWLPHWLGRRPGAGHAAALQVVQPDGRVTGLQLVQDPADALHWHGGGAAADEVELWLLPTPPHWPRRWRHTTPWGSVSEWSLMHQDEADESPPPP